MGVLIWSETIWTKTDLIIAPPYFLLQRKHKHLEDFFVACDVFHNSDNQARNQGWAGGRRPLEIFSTPCKNVLDII